MEKIKIMTDSASDISAADEKRYDISILPYLVTLGDRSYTSRVDFDNEKFYGMMAQYDGIPKTSQITPSPPICTQFFKKSASALWRVPLFFVGKRVVLTVYRLRAPSSGLEFSVFKNFKTGGNLSEYKI